MSLSSRSTVEKSNLTNIVLIQSPACHRHLRRRRRHLRRRRRRHLRRRSQRRSANPAQRRKTRLDVKEAEKKNLGLAFFPFPPQTSLN